MGTLRRPRRVAPVLAVVAVLAAAAAGAAVTLAGSDGPTPLQVVAIRVDAASGPAERATGVVLGAGRVLTVAHVLAAGGEVEVRGPDGTPRRASVLRTDPALDLAVLAVAGVDAPAPQVAADPGTRARVLVTRDGAMRERAATVRRQITARLVDVAGRPRRPSLELGADVRAGDSGAPVVRDDGHLVGIVYATSRRRAGTAYAVRGPGLRRLVGSGR